MQERMCASYGLVGLRTARDKLARHGALHRRRSFQGLDRKSGVPGVERALFLVVLLLNLAIFVFLIADQRMVRGHDTFLYYSLQYSFMANATATGEVALWMPHLTQGTSE